MADQETNVVNAVKTTTSGVMSAGATSLGVASVTGFPSVPFYICVDPTDPAKREYMLIDDSVIGTTLSMTAIGKRNLSGSAGAVEHASGAEVRVSPPMAQLFQDLNDRVDAAETALAGKSSTSHTHDTAWSKSIGVTGEVKVPSGAVDYLTGFTVFVESGEVLTFTHVYDEIRSGTSVTYKITKNGSDQVTGLSATTTNNVTDIADFTAVTGDRIKIVVTAVSGTPDGLEVTLGGTVTSID